MLEHDEWVDLYKEYLKEWKNGYRNAMNEWKEKFKDWKTQAKTTIVKRLIGIEKKGPKYAHSGDLIKFTINVKNFKFITFTIIKSFKIFSNNFN